MPGVCETEAIDKERRSVSEVTVPDACGSRGIKDSTNRLVKLLSTGVAGVGREEHAEVRFFDEETAAGTDRGRHPAQCPFGLGKVHEKSSAMHEVVGPRLEVLYSAIPCKLLQALFSIKTSLLLSSSCVPLQRVASDR